MKRVLGGVFCLLSSWAMAAEQSLDNLDAPLAALRPGQFFWRPEISPQGPITLVVSLTEQKVYVYRNGIAIGVSTVSTGKKGKETPTGVFSILQKKERHHSNLYNNAPMPYMQRLTWDGIALHAGQLPGYPASQGCIRLPMEFARKLYGITGFSSTTVIISDSHSAPVEVYHPGLLSPTVTDGRAMAPVAAPVTPFWSDPGLDEGPLSVLASRADRRVYVYRGGVQIGSAPIVLTSPDARIGVAAFSLLEKPTAEQVGSENPSLRWSTISVSTPEEGHLPDQQQAGFTMDPAFLRSLLAAMDVGSTVVITDLPSTRETQSGTDFTVMTTKSGDLQ